MLRWIILTLSLWMMAGSAMARQSFPLDTGYTKISLVSDHDTVAAGQSFTVALRMQFDGGWYTYWRNAGDSGEAVRIDWTLPDGVSAGPIQWPAPKVKSVGPIVSYAMAGDVWLPVEIKVDASVDTSRPMTLNAHAYFLVCDDVCVPEDGALSLPMGLGAAVLNPKSAPKVKKALAKIPQLGAANGSALLEAGQLRIDIQSDETDFAGAEIFPHENPILAHSDPISQTMAANGVRYIATPGYGWDKETPADFAATLVNADGSAEIVPITTNGSVNIGAISNMSSAVIGDGAGLGFWGAVFGALLGGLILNLMPCVFPIISLKALSLAKTAHGERRAVRIAGWAYTAGVLISFAVFAFILIGLKAAGATVGWGFQMQSPWLVGVLALLLFAIGLNLLGVFEIGGRFQNVGADMTHDGGPISSFLTGVLAVIVATPCSVAFMAGAVGYALASSAAASFAVFLALGLGFALPFLILAYAPGLLARLPKPGPWMETFRQLLAFPMFAAAIWLVWVISIQTDANGVAKLLLSGLTLSFAIWLFRKGGRLSKILGALTLAASIALPLSVKAPNAVNGEAALSSESWSPEAVAMARAEGRPVFVDFTAAWCVTCKVNEMRVLKTKKTADLFDRTDTQFLIADWTNKDDVIAAELARFGRAGVPLYLMYSPGVEAPEILPQFLTHDILKDALE
jgi:thiol:disulfide interchange protein/DsbC/DsbD-like thiol-disulfide interchange protein